MIVLHFVPDELSDEAAAHLLEYLYGLAGAFENQYFAQICRYKASLRHASGTYDDERRAIERACHDEQLDLFVDDDVTF